MFLFAPWRISSEIKYRKNENNEITSISFGIGKYITSAEFKNNIESVIEIYVYELLPKLKEEIEKDN